MTHPAMLLWLLTASLAASAASTSKSIDPVTSQIGFTLTTRWGQTLEGRFPHYEGEVAGTEDGRHLVRLRLSTRDVEIVGHSTYTRLTRGGGFFDAERLLLVGHNPGLEQLAALMHSGQSGDHRGMPPGGIVVLTLPVDATIEPGIATLSAFWWP